MKPEASVLGTHLINQTLQQQINQSKTKNMKNLTAIFAFTTLFMGYALAAPAGVSPVKLTIPGEDSETGMLQEQTLWPGHPTEKSRKSVWAERVKVCASIGGRNGG